MYGNSIIAAQQQAEADGSRGGLPECPQLSLSVRRTRGRKHE